MTGSVLKGAVGEGFVEPVGGCTAVLFCFVWIIEGGVLTTLVEASGNVAISTIGDVSCFCGAVETWIENVFCSFDVVMGILVFSDDEDEASETGNPVAYTVVVTNVDGVSDSVGVVETSLDGISVSYIVAGSGVDVSSSLRDVVGELSEGGNLVSYALVGANVTGISGSTDVVEISVDGSSVSYIVTGTDVDNFSSFRDVVKEPSEGGNPVSYAVVGTNVDGISDSSAGVETSRDGGSVLCIVGADAVDTSSSLCDAVEEASECTGNPVSYIIGILVSFAVAETFVDGICLSCDFSETSVDGCASGFVNVVETAEDSSSGLSLMSSSGGPLVFSITTDVSVLSIISAAKTCMRFQPVTFSISKAIASWYILFKDKTRT